MVETNEKPELLFFRMTPDGLMSRPPLCSSLQNLESSFLLIAVGRFPHALVTTASSVESAMKSALNSPQDDFINADKLYKRATNHYPGLSSFDDTDLKAFRFARNGIAHYGFSPRDDEVTAELLLRAGFPFLVACYEQFFNFDLLGSLVTQFAKQLRIALNIYQLAKGKPDLVFTRFFSAFAHQVRWSVREWHMADWEIDAVAYAEETGTKSDYYEKRRQNLGRVLDPAWFFDCPICDEPDALVCELDNERLDDREVALKRAVCACCGLVVRANTPSLADELCREQIESKREAILRELGLAGP